MLLRRSFAGLFRSAKVARRFLSAEEKKAPSAPSSSTNAAPNTFGATQNPTVSPKTKRNNAIIGLIVGGAAASVYFMGIQKLKKVGMVIAMFG